MDYLPEHHDLFGDHHHDQYDFAHVLHYDHGYVDYNVDNEYNLQNVGDGYNLEHVNDGYHLEQDNFHFELDQNDYDQFGIHHNVDCDTAYADSPIENGVCNISENNGFIDDVRECLQTEQSNDVGFIERHLDCFLEEIME